MTSRPLSAHAPAPLIRDMTVDDCEAVARVRVSFDVDGVAVAEVRYVRTLSPPEAG